MSNIRQNLNNSTLFCQFCVNFKSILCQSYVNFMSKCHYVICKRKLNTGLTPPPFYVKKNRGCSREVHPFPLKARNLNIVNSFQKSLDWIWTEQSYARNFSGYSILFKVNVVMKSDTDARPIIMIMIMKFLFPCYKFRCYSRSRIYYKYNNRGK